MGSIHMYSRLGLGVYGPYTCIYTDIEACVQSRANIYIYTCLHLGTQGQFQPVQPKMATGSYGILPLASIYINIMHIQCQGHVYMATYSHIQPYIQYIHTRMVHKKTSQHNYSQEADVYYTKLTKLWCNDTQLLCGRLQQQSSYFAMW